MELLTFGTAVLMLGGALVALYREVRMVHRAVNSRLTEALARIQQLGDALHKAGITRPDPPPRD